MIYLYDLLLLLFFIPAVVLLAVRYRKRLASEFLFKAGERFGFWGIEQVHLINGQSGIPKKPLIWIHCASLGEVKAVEPILKKLNNYSLLVTTVTLSGRQYAQAAKLADHVFFVPFDFSFLVKKVFKKVRASALLLVETELWPGLIDGASSCGAEIFLVNARLSAHSYPMYRAARLFWGPVLGRIDYLLARSKEDADRFCGVGFPREKVTITGNIKYDNDTEKRACTREELGFKGTDIIWVCGSTRNGENEILLSVWKELKENFPSLKLVIAPRHLNRAKDIAKILRRTDCRYALRSIGGEKDPDCLVLDTFGELWKYYSICDMAFVGGSLVDMGGQNPIEPAAFSKPVLFGRHMENFISEAGALLKIGGGFESADGRDLADKMKKLLENAEFRAEVGKKAFDAVQAQKGAVSKTVEIINSALINLQKSGGHK